MEKQVYDKLFNSVKLHINKWQYGFLPGRSTVSQLIQVVHEYAKALEKKQQVDSIKHSIKCLIINFCINLSLLV